MNLKCATLAAISDIAEVMVVGHATTNDDFCYAMPGTKVRKLHSSRRDAFKVVNDKPFAKISSDRITPYTDYKFKQKIIIIIILFWALRLFGARRFLGVGGPN